MLTLIRTILPAVLVMIAAVTARADSKGQADLDKATEAKLNATTITDLGDIIRLTESALKKGLDPGNTEFANKLLVSTLLLRARETSKQLRAGAGSIEEFLQKRDLALVDLERAIVLDPKQPETYLLITQLNLLPQGNTKRAREAIEKALELGFEEPSSHAKAMLLRASLQETPEKKLADLNEAVRLAPAEAAAIRARGLLLADLDKLEPALVDLDKAIQLDADDGPTYEAKAIVLARLKKYDEALIVLDKAQQLSPDSLAPLLQRARVHATQEKLEAALDDISQALAKSPDNIVALLMRSGVYETKGDRAKALADVDEVLKLKPDLPVAIRTRAAILAEEKRFDEAVAELQKLRKIDPKDTLTLLSLAILYTMQEKTSDAIESYTALLAESPDEWAALRGRGDVYLNVGRQAEAIADYERALKLQPKDYSILNNLAWVLATSPDPKIRNGKRSLELATSACEATEYKMAYILSTLAAAYAESGDMPSAIKWSSKAVEISDKEHSDSLKKELESYKAGKPWREAIPKEKAAKLKEAKPSPKP
jgi:tetratricopeptide (TPR) repeat protein